MSWCSGQVTTWALGNKRTLRAARSAKIRKVQTTIGSTLLLLRSKFAASRHCAIHWHNHNTHYLKLGPHLASDQKTKTKTTTGGAVKWRVLAAWIEASSSRKAPEPGTLANKAPLSLRCDPRFLSFVVFQLSTLINIEGYHRNNKEKGRKRREQVRQWQTTKYGVQWCSSRTESIYFFRYVTIETIDVPAIRLDSPIIWSLKHSHYRSAPTTR